MPSAKLLITDGDGDRRNYRVNFDRIANELKFSPAWTLDQGIEQIVRALKSDAVTHYADEEYSNVKVISELVRAESVSAYRDQQLRLLDSSSGYVEDPEETIQTSRVSRR
jgi:dTDP-D-glucose 4,6-dehydratase